MNLELIPQPNTPFDYHYVRELGSHLLRTCAFCGAELEYLGETLDGAKAREASADPWDGECAPTYEHKNRDRRLDRDDHDRCQC